MSLQLSAARSSPQLRSSNMISTHYSSAQHWLRRLSVATQPALPTKPRWGEPQHPPSAPTKYSSSPAGRASPRPLPHVGARPFPMRRQTPRPKRPSRRRHRRERTPSLSPMLFQIPSIGPPLSAARAWAQPPRPSGPSASRSVTTRMRSSKVAESGAITSRRVGSTRLARSGESSFPSPPAVA